MQEQILVAEKAGLLARPDEWHPGNRTWISFVKHDHLHFGVERQAHAARPSQLSLNILRAQVFF